MDAWHRRESRCGERKRGIDRSRYVTPQPARPPEEWRNWRAAKVERAASSCAQLKDIPSLETFPVVSFLIGAIHLDTTS